MEIEKLKNLIDSSNYIVFFGGAGVSTESGIKDFRGKNGLYQEKTNGLPPEYMLSHDCLVYDTKLFFDYYRNNINLLKMKPNVTHNYLKKLEDSGKLKAIITQNKYLPKLEKMLSPIANGEEYYQNHQKEIDGNFEILWTGENSQIK